MLFHLIYYLLFYFVEPGLQDAESSNSGTEEGTFEDTGLQLRFSDLGLQKFDRIMHGPLDMK